MKLQVMHKDPHIDKKKQLFMESFNDRLGHRHYLTMAKERDYQYTFGFIFT